MNKLPRFRWQSQNRCTQISIFSLWSNQQRVNISSGNGFALNGRQTQLWPSWLTHICITEHQYVKVNFLFYQKNIVTLQCQLFISKYYIFLCPSQTIYYVVEQCLIPLERIVLTGLGENLDKALDGGLTLLGSVRWRPMAWTQTSLLAFDKGNDTDMWKSKCLIWSPWSEAG